MTGVLRGKILLATDGSDDAATAARAAADLAEKTGSELHVAHAWHAPVGVMPAPIPIEVFEQDARRLLDKEAGRLAAGETTVAGTHLVRDHPVDAILGLAEDLGVGLIVVGSRGRGVLERLVLGSVSEGVVHHARAPVLVARGGAWPPDRVLIGDDGSGAARVAGELAGRIGRLLGASAVLVRAAPEPVLPMQLPEYEQSLHDRLIEDNRRLGQKALDGRATELEALLGSRPETVFVTGDATFALLETAAGRPSTLVAVGSRGLGAARRIALGSVSTKLLRMASGPVLIHPGEDIREAGS